MPFSGRFILTVENEWVPALLHWFDETKRDLPWRANHPRDPYHVWVSEIMLQQTRTEAVKDYYVRWMAAFPTVSALAQASEEEVLKLWQGLGYYSRARNLHKAAREIVLQYHGIFPDTLEAVRALPGIGDYTAGAILSMAFGHAVPAVDGNLLRVMARLFGISDDILSLKGKRIIGRIAQTVIPQDRPGDFNEALMDLGATICIPHVPRCGSCPLKDFCTAFLENRTSELPVRKKKKAPTIYEVTSLFIRKQGALLLHKRPETGLLASLWELPTFLGKTEKESRKEAERMLGTVEGKIIWTHRHVFTHQIWQMTVYLGTIPCSLPDPSYVWVDEGTLGTLPLCGPAEKCLAACLPGVILTR